MFRSTVLSVWATAYFTAPHDLCVVKPTGQRALPSTSMLQVLLIESCFHWFLSVLYDSEAGHLTACRISLPSRKNSRNLDGPRHQRQGRPSLRHLQGPVGDGRRPLQAHCRHVNDEHLKGYFVMRLNGAEPSLPNCTARVIFVLLVLLAR